MKNVPTSSPKLKNKRVPHVLGLCITVVIQTSRGVGGFKDSSVVVA